MLNRRTVLLGIFCILFVTSTVLGQTEPSQSEILNAVHKVDKEVAVLSTKMEGVEGQLDQKIDLSIKAVDDRLGERLNGIGKQIEGMNQRIDNLQGTLNWIRNGIIIILLYIVGHITKPWWEKRIPLLNKTKENLEVEKPREEIKGDDFLDNTQPDYQTAGGGS